MVTGLAAGFAINANLKELSKTATMSAGVGAVAFFAIFNAAGRIGWGGLFDRIDYYKVLTGNLIFQAVMLFLSPFILKFSFGLQLLAIITGFNYGGVLVLYAGTVANYGEWSRLEWFTDLLFSSNDS